MCPVKSDQAKAATWRDIGKLLENLTSLRILGGGVGPVDLEARLATMADTARATEVSTNIRS